jgi:dTDP-4-dehydrorhamnose 3,5-epimerase
MKIIDTELPGVVIIEPQVFEDDRGWFAEAYSADSIKQAGLEFFAVQENHAYSKVPYIIRGLHFQNKPYEQAKLVRCTAGKVLDVAVDLRHSSLFFLKWVAVELSAENKRQLFIPKGFAHGAMSLARDTEIQYFVDEQYSPEYDRAIRFDDPQICVKWGADKPVLSPKDQRAPRFAESDCNYK